MLEETIVAIATPLGEGCIGVIRISGPGAIEIGRKVFRPKKNIDWHIKENYRLVYGHIINPQNEEMIDEVLLSVMRGPHSFTAHDVVEFSCHGRIVSLRRVLQ